MVAQLYRHYRSASRQSEKVQSGKFHRPQSRDGAWVECFELVGVSSGRATKCPGKSTDAAPPTWHPVQFVRRCSYFLRVRGHLHRKNKLGNNAKLALVRIFGSRQVLPSRVANSSGKIPMATPQYRRLLLVDVRASVRSACSATSAGEQRNSAAIDVALRSISPSTPERSMPAGKCQGRFRWDSNVAQIFRRHWFASLRMEIATGHITEAAPSKRHLVGLFRVVNSPPGWPIPPNK